MDTKRYYITLLILRQISVEYYVSGNATPLYIKQGKLSAFRQLHFTTSSLTIEHTTLNIKPTSQLNIRWDYSQRLKINNKNWNKKRWPKSITTYYNVFLYKNPEVRLFDDSLYSITSILINKIKAPEVIKLYFDYVSDER